MIERLQFIPMHFFEMTTTAELEPSFQMQALKPKKIKSCGNCHQKEFQPQIINKQQMWVKAHPLIQHGSACSLPVCLSLKDCNLKACK